MKKYIRTCKMIRQKIIGFAIMSAAVPLSYIMDGDLTLPIAVVVAGFILVVQKKLLSEITAELAKKEIKENEEELK